MVIPENERVVLEEFFKGTNFSRAIPAAAIADFLSVVSLDGGDTEEGALGELVLKDDADARCFGPSWAAKFAIGNFEVKVVSKEEALNECSHEEKDEDP